MVCGRSFVVADGAAAPGYPGQGPLDDPAAGHDYEMCTSSGRLTISTASFGLSLVRAQATSFPAQVRLVHDSAQRPDAVMALNQLR